MNAAPSIDELLTRVPELGEHTVAPPALTPISQIRNIERALRASIGASPGDARGYAMLGNLLARRSLYLQARDAYVRAIALDPEFAQAHLAVAELSSILRDDERAREHVPHALKLQRRFDDPLPLETRTPVLMLLKDAPYAVNTPLELILDRKRVALHKYYVGESPLEPLPSHSLVVTAFGPEYGDERLVDNACAIAGPNVNTINSPRMLGRCARAHLAASLCTFPDVQAVETRVVDRAALQNIELPSLVRPTGTQAGYGLARIETKGELEQHAHRFSTGAYDVSRFIEYRSDDGYYRKYRAIVVDGRAYPYHLAISPRWMVHYQSSPMDQFEWMRDEERAFLQRPTGVFPMWDNLGPNLAEALGLDYFGADITLARDGTVLVFEADPAMLVHDEEDGGDLAYKRPYVDAIRRALHRLIEDRAAP